MTEQTTRGVSAAESRGVRGWLSGRVLYGGVWTRRVDVLRDLQRCGLSALESDRYLQGLELGQRLRGETEP